ncbi:MAG: hypothetical protein PHN84_08805 [Desulfuromonadaceae bacterium]|nr:hypothetical protein [Desulfuromonadaceae bacterium]MDD2854742.1 hypothetical protein [Desulfuromonadaceae bacterium]
MYLKKMNSLTIYTLLTLLLCSSPAFGGAILSINTIGDKSYSIQGSNMDGVSGIQLEISYDTSSLKAPNVVQGGLVSGAMIAANTSIPGKIIIAIISTKSFSGNGQIANITFATKTGNGKLTIDSSNIIDSNGSPVTSLNSDAVENNQTISTTETSTPSNIALSNSPQQPQEVKPSPINQGTQTISTPIQTYLGTVTLPAINTPEQETPEPSVTVITTSDNEAGSTSSKTEPVHEKVSSKIDETKPNETPQYIVYKGIIDRFKNYGSDKNLSNVIKLFEKKVCQIAQQNPQIMVSDGKNSAILTIDLPPRISTSPNFAVNNGKLVSFYKDEKTKGRWTAEVLPTIASSMSTLTIIAGVEEFECPITVTQPLNDSISLDEKGWNRFITEIGPAESPLHDLNSDGVRDYKDEFIFVANYLLNTSIKPKQEKPVIPPKR